MLLEFSEFRGDFYKDCTVLKFPNPTILMRRDYRDENTITQDKCVRSHEYYFNKGVSKSTIDREYLIKYLKYLTKYTTTNSHISSSTV